MADIYEVERETRTFIHVDIDRFIECHPAEYAEYAEGEELSASERREFVGDSVYEMGWHEFADGPWVVKHPVHVDESFNFTKVDA